VNRQVRSSLTIYICPGWRISAQAATTGFAAVASDENCGSVVERVDGTDPEATDNIDGTTGLNCGYPETGTWADVCYVVDPDNLADVLRARCDQTLTKAYVFQIFCSSTFALSLSCTLFYRCRVQLFV
jgi:hypothetical protein